MVSIINKQLDKIKQKSDMMVDTITNKLVDENLLKAISKDFKNLSSDVTEKINEMILSQTYIYQILKLLCEEKNIIIPKYIKDYFRL